MAIKRINSYIDIPAVKGEHEKFSQFLIDDYNSIVKLFNAISKYKTGGAGFSDATKNAKELDDAIKKTTQSSSELEKQKAKLVALESKEAQAIAFTKQQIADQNKELRIQAQNETAVAGSIEAARAKLKDLTNQRDVLNLSTEKGKAKAAELNEEINKQNDFIKTNVSLLEQQKINIGNYSGSFQKAFAALDTELKKIRSQIATTGKDSPGIDQLNKKAELLEKLMGGLNQSFGSSRQELRALTEASKQLGTEFGITSNEFQSFVKEVGERKDQLDDIQKTINFQSSDTKYIDGVVNAVQGVVGAYGAWQAASALIGTENKDIQESMQKLQAVLTLVTSIQAVANALQTESGAIQTILAGKAALLAAAIQLQTFAHGANAAATVVDTVATEANAVANVEGAVAMEAGAAAAATLETGMIGAAAAEGAAAAGAVSLSTALIATGIGALIIGVVYGITKLVQASIKWVSINDDVVKSNTELSKSLNDVITAQKEYDGIRKAANDSVISQLEDENNLLKVRGITTMHSLALDKNVAAERLKLSKDELDNNKDKLKDLDLYAVKALQAANAVVKAEDKIRFYREDAAKKGEKVNEDVLAHYQTEADAATANATLTKSTYENLLNVRDTYNKDVQNADNIQGEIDKQNADDHRKFILESAKIEADIITTKNDRILANEKSSEQLRIAAMESNLQQRLNIIRAENASIQNDPTVSGTDKSLATKKAAADEQAAIKDSQIAIYNLKESYRLRDIAARTEINKIALEKQQQVNKDLADNDILFFSQRLDAEKKYLEAKKHQNDDAYKKQLADAGISEEEISKLIADPSYRVSASNKTQKEIEAITAAHYAAQQNIVLEGEQNITAIIQSEFNKQVELSKEAFDKIDQGYQSQFVAASNSYSSELIALNKSLIDKKISIEKYNREREKLDIKNAKKQTDILVSELEIQVQAIAGMMAQLSGAKDELANAQNLLTIAETDDEKKAAAEQVKIAEAKYKRFADLQKQFNDASKSLDDAKDKQSDEAVKKEAKRQQELSDLKKQLAQEVYNLAVTLVNNQFENELNTLEEKKKVDDETYSKEVENINNSTLSAQEKANQLAILDKEKETRDIAYDRKQKEIKIRQAKFEKAKAIAEVAFNTAVAIAKVFRDYTFLAGLPLAAAMGAIGAIQIAAIASRPIPQYKDGLENNPVAHLGIYGEAGAELIEKPGQKPFVAKRATLDFLPVGTSITPIAGDELNGVMHHALLQSMASSAMWLKADKKQDNQLLDAVNKQTRMIIGALNKNQRPVKVTNKIDLGWADYLNKQIYH